jgi:DNA-binding MarR family transcriptional regulator
MVACGSDAGKLSGYIVYILLRYNMRVNKTVTTEEYRALAELRYRLRQFLRDGDDVMRAAGLEPQQYLMLLAIRGLPEGEEPTIQTLAQRMTLKHHSAVELIDRLVRHGYVRRGRDSQDRRRVLVSLLSRGKKVLEEVARHRIGELRSNRHQLARAIDRLLERTPESRLSNHPKATSRMRGKRE